MLWVKIIVQKEFIVVWPENNYITNFIFLISPNFASGHLTAIYTPRSTINFDKTVFFSVSLSDHKVILLAELNRL